MAVIRNRPVTLESMVPADMTAVERRSRIPVSGESSTGSGVVTPSWSVG